MCDQVALPGIFLDQRTIDPDRQRRPTEALQVHMPGGEGNRLQGSQALPASCTLAMDSEDDCPFSPGAKHCRVVGVEENVTTGLDDPGGFDKHLRHQLIVFGRMPGSVLVTAKRARSQVRRCGDHQAGRVIGERQPVGAGFEEKKGHAIDNLLRRQGFGQGEAVLAGIGSAVVHAGNKVTHHGLAATHPG